MITKDTLKKGLVNLNKALGPVDNIFSRNTDNYPPLFIVGTPRSGTTLTYQLITQQFDVGYFTAFMGYLYGIPNTLHYVMRPILRRPKTIFESNYGKIKGILSPSEHPNYWFQWFPSDSEQGHYIDPEEVKLEEYATLRQGIESITAIMRKPMVFKCLYLDMSVGVLSQIFPNAKFLFVRRDQFFVCQSLLLGRLKQKDINEWWSVKPPHYRDLLSLPIWQQVTEQVFQTEKIISRDLSRFAGDRYLEVHYEKLCKEPQPVLEEISSWLAASGYKVYDDINFPQEFTVSQKINLSKTMADKIKSHLTVLKEQDKY